MPGRGGSTIYGVAAQAGVSISTVSRFLNSPEKVNAETARRIKLSMDQLDYFPHGNAGKRAYRSIRRVGVLTPFFPAPSFVQRMQGMIAVFREAHCEMVICTVDTPEQLSEYLHSISFLCRFDGLIIMSMHLGDEDSSRLVESGLHVVVIESVNPRFTSVETDNVLGGRLAAQCFLEKGYLPCAFIGEQTSLPYSLQPSSSRLSGLQAIGVLKAARQRSIAVPGALAVLGFDDIEAASYVDLSTVSQSLEESGRVAAQLLIDGIREPGRPRQRVHLDVRILERETT